MRLNSTQWFRFWLVLVVAATGVALTGCSKEEQQGKAPTVGKTESLPTTKAAVDKGVEQASTVGRTESPSPIAPKSDLTNPCEEDCAFIGTCTFRDGSCVVGGPEDCIQSKICRDTGACSVHQETYENGEVLSTCQALGDADCEDSKVCKEQGRCKEVDGQCLNMESDETRSMRALSLRTVRSSAWATAMDCEGMKNEVVSLLRREYKDPEKVWAEPERAHPEIAQTILKWRMSLLPMWSSQRRYLGSNCELLGEPCCSDLMAAVEKVHQECFFDGHKKQLDWIMKAGGASCGPSSTPKSSECGQDSAQGKVKELADWVLYSCQFKEDAPDVWGKCLGYRDYAEEALWGCPGRMMCCPPSKKAISEIPSKKVVAPDLSCGSGEQFSCLQLAAKKEAEGDFDSAALAFEKACGAGQPEGCHRLGKCYDKGKGVTEDKKKAVVLYTEACKAGYKKACTSFAFLALTHNPSGSKKQAQMGWNILKRTCAQGEEGACKIQRVYEAEMAKKPGN